MNEYSSLNKHIEEFKSRKIWIKGYFEGNPLDPSSLARSFNEIKGNQHLAYSKNNKSWLHEVYLECIKPYINKNTKALEIGPGIGGWTKCMLDAETIHVLDIAPPNNFWQYIGDHKHIKYIQVKDFLCEDLEKDYFNYVFSMGTLCHIPFEGIRAYAENIYDKLRSKAECFWMVADEKKFSLATNKVTKFPKAYVENSIGCFYQHGIEETCKMLENIGYEIICQDVDLIPRDPLIHFRKK